MSITPLEKELREQIVGDVRFDTITRKIYSVDASIYEIEPVGVVYPKNREDVISAIQIAYRHKTPVIARGAATGITGGCIGKGLILDLSKYMNKVLEVNFTQEYAVCEPGVVQDFLNQQLAKQGYRLGPDTSTGNRATLGGMVANNSAGARSLKFGKMVDHVEAVELILADGKHTYLHQLSAEEWESECSGGGPDSAIYREINRIKTEYHEEIIAHFPRIPRRASGYNLDTLVNASVPNLAKVVVGSEGSLGVVTSIKVKIVKKPAYMGLSVLHFHEMIDAMQQVPYLLEFHPIAIEMIDRQILQMGRLSPSTQNKLGWLQGDPEAVFAVEFEGETEQEVIEKLTHFDAEMRVKQIGYAITRLTTPAEMNNVWNVRKSGLGLLLSKRSYSRAIAFVEDVSVAPQLLASFMREFKECLKKHDKEAGIYGHVGSGCMHVRPYIDLSDPQELSLMSTLMDEVADLVLKHGGAMSGEHGDGIVRTWLNEKMFGTKLYQAFIELKRAFDPENRMNPGKVVEGQAFLEHLRTNPETKKTRIPTFLDFSREGGFELSADLCNGNGMCRKKETVMCPSFHATGDEYETTRARAQTLRSIVNGRLPLKDLTGDAVMDVLDLCLECKGCKTECPSQVDMAKMKAEILYQHQEAHGYTFRSKLFGHIGTVNRLFQPISGLFNWINRSRLGKKLLGTAGIAIQRELPALTPHKFSSWVKKQKKGPQEKQVVLFNDTYMEYNDPEIGQAAYQVLTALGYEVIVPQWQCCGRPLISKGLLKQAKRKAETLVATLLPYAQKGIPIVGLEPSCILTVKDDFVGLLGADHAYVDQVIAACTTFDEFVSLHVKEGKLNLSFKDDSRPVKLHGHCHQKSLVGTAPTLKVLKAIPGFEVAEIASGCCGLAGSFGYEAEHYALSMKIGELHLLPAVRQSVDETIIVADGISCRSQIAHGTSRKAYHLAQVIADRLQEE